MQAKRIALAAKEACENKKAKDCIVLDIRKLANFAHYFVIASGTSDRHVRAVAEHVAESLRNKGVKEWHTEGKREGRWVLVDYGDVIVHVFHHEVRSYYALERLWGDDVVV